MPVVKRKVWVIKERVRAIRHALPFTTIHRLMTSELVKFVVMLLNAFPLKGCLTNYSPRRVILGTIKDYRYHCKTPFGAYVQVHEENSPTNTLDARSSGAISLGLDYCATGGYNFLSLLTGKKIHRRQWTSLPMHDSIIGRVESLGLQDNQPSIGDPSLDVDGNLIEVPITGVEPHVTGGPPAGVETLTTPSGVDHHPPEAHTFTKEVVDPKIRSTTTEIPSTTSTTSPTTKTTSTTQVSSLTDPLSALLKLPVAPTTEITPKPPPPSAVEHLMPSPQPSPHDSPPVMDHLEVEFPPLRKSTRNTIPIERLNPSTGQSYCNAAIKGNDNYHAHKLVTNLCLAQYSLSSGIKSLGSKGVADATKELDQLHFRKTFTPVSLSNLSLY